ncbi:MAG: serpin family protein [Deltaproteobacteria bacterium]|jgi:serpin B|nr:serpin family protein [Deltaproteobacteria bacterium]
MRSVLTIAVLALMAFPVLLWPSQASAQRSGGTEAGPSQEAVAAASGASAFGLNLFRSLAARDGNLFMSPVSVAGVLAMAYAGAAGDTASAFEGALGMPAKGEAYLKSWKGLEDSLKAASGEGSELSLAGSMWPDGSVKLKRDFLRTVERSFGARIEPQDFAGGGDAPREAINAWAARETRDRVKDLIPMPLPPDTRLVLANAVYFKGGWLEPFDKAETREGRFQAAPKRVTASFMRRTGPFGYLEDELGQVLEIPYRGRRLSMFVLLPASASGGMASLEASLAGETLAARIGKASMERVDASLPRFSFGWGTESLLDPLSALGLAPAFGGGADFSGMTGDRSLKISDVLHRAFVDVTEEGTEAAAASAAVITRALPAFEPPKVFKADRPFVFLIRDRESGAILFMGRVTDPTAS